MEQFKCIGITPSGTIYFFSVTGERVEVGGQKAFIFKEKDSTKWGDIEGHNVSHLETGMCMARDFTSKGAIAKAEQNLNSEPDAIKKAIEMLKIKKINFPINV